MNRKPKMPPISKANEFWSRVEPGASAKRLSTASFAAVGR